MALRVEILVLNSVMKVKLFVLVFESGDLGEFCHKGQVLAVILALRFEILAVNLALKFKSFVLAFHFELIPCYCTWR